MDVLPVAVIRANRLLFLSEPLARKRPDGCLKTGKNPIRPSAGAVIIDKVKEVR